MIQTIAQREDRPTGPAEVSSNRVLPLPAGRANQLCWHSLRRKMDPKRFWSGVRPVSLSGAGQALPGEGWLARLARRADGTLPRPKPIFSAITIPGLAARTTGRRVDAWPGIRDQLA